MRDLLKFLVDPFFNTFYNRVLIFALISVLFLRARKFKVPILNVSFV